MNVLLPISPLTGLASQEELAFFQTIGISLLTPVLWGLLMGTVHNFPSMVALTSSQHWETEDQNRTCFKTEPGVVAHTFNNPTTLQSEAGASLSSRQAWATE